MFVVFFFCGGGGGLWGKKKMYRKLAGRLNEYNSYSRGPAFDCFYQLY